jgi:hypothetical protein
MTGFEGLNLPQLLDLMHDLVRAEPVAWTPQTIGWAVVAVWLVTVTGLIIWHRIQHWRRNRYRREALAELRQIGQQQDLDQQGMAYAIATLLKRTALAAFERSQVADLYGNEWADFLRRSSGNDSLIERNADALGNAAYSKAANGQDLLVPAKRWIQVHRV